MTLLWYVMQDEVAQHVIRTIWHEIEKLRSLLSSRIEAIAVGVAGARNERGASLVGRDSLLLNSFRQMRAARHRQDLQTQNQLSYGASQRYVSAHPQRSPIGIRDGEQLARNAKTVMKTRSSIAGQQKRNPRADNIISLMDVTTDLELLHSNELSAYREEELTMWREADIQGKPLKMPKDIGGATAVATSLVNRGLVGYLRAGSHAFSMCCR